MLALIGFVGLAMSSFIMLGGPEDHSDAPPAPDDLLPPSGDTGLTEVAPGLFQLLSDTNGDAGAGGVLAETDADVATASGLSDTFGDAGAGGVLAETDADAATASGLSDTYGDAGAGGVLADATTLPVPDTGADSAFGVSTDTADTVDYGDDMLPDPIPAGDPSVADASPPDDGPVDPSTAAMIRRVGSDSDDTIDGDTGNDEVYGGGGKDLITGNMGDDILFGEDGADSMNGGSGNDLLFGGAGDDILEGGWGDDSLTGGEGRDLLNGGGGNDVLDGRDADGGFDYLNGGAGDDLLLAGAGDHLNGGEGADIFSLTRDGANTIDDFDAARDVIEVTYSGTPPVLSTMTADDGLTLLADDTVVAHLAGLKDFDLSSVILTAA
ncbi:calcium-binding protein [Loktanella sp. M215]|uniref:calcium-binding protein n=1 Tax=Loktanella sp. M215 TaxID=2675431 RepID=UPI001F46357B|nr:calcium-binding protein [Loktanella sp. M215]MCF7699270.1 hypothetical protein [Loktanella sp. M215]